ncbi:hypothetical protein EV363DRAFT_1183542 [Boletus edulis]|nr:hypothetical protein EV363DRAFT_1183542 [Boletus edulis]
MACPEDNVSPPQEEGQLSTPSLGRRSARINKILTEGYYQLEKTLTDLTAQTSLTAQQILDGWSKSHGRIINGTNHRNSYAKYLAKHEEQERCRLSISPDDPITPTLRRQLYAKFKDDHGEQWQEILETHDMLEISDSLPQTMAQRAQTFNRTSKTVASFILLCTHARHATIEPAARGSMRRAYTELNLPKNAGESLKAISEMMWSAEVDGWIGKEVVEVTAM